MAASLNTAKRSTKEYVSSGDMDVGNKALDSIKAGETSFANAQANSVTTMFENIPLDQEIFYDAITYYEYELGKNENNKTIKLIGDGVASIAADNFATRLAEDSDQT